MPSAHLETGLFLAGSTALLEGYLMRHMPRLREVCREHKVIAIATTLLVTAGVTATVGATGTELVIAQVTSSVLAVFIIYRRRRPPWRLSRTILHAIQVIDQSDTHTGVRSTILTPC